MHIALAQINPTIGDLAGNIARIKSIYGQAKEKKVDLVIFSELVVSGYPPKDLLLYKSYLQRERRIIEAELLPLTKKGGPAILIGATSREEGKLYNSALLIQNGEIKSAHHKSLLPNYDVFDEERYFTPAQVLKVEKIGHIATAVTICEDLWNDGDFFSEPLYPKDPLQTLFAGGARLLINISASPYHFGKQHQRENLLSHLAKKYEAPIIYVNQVGGNDELIFDGGSLVCNCHGEIICRGKAFAEDLIFVESESLYAAAKKPLAAAREDIDSIMNALLLGLKDYVKKTGFSKVILGLSGGVDSAVVAVLAVKALGAENVFALMMPSPYSSGHSIEDAVILADKLNIGYMIIPIEQPFKSYLDLLNEGGEAKLDLAEENLQARIRGNLLMHFSNREGYLALATGNKSELAVGYCTLYGDMSGGLAVIADLPKMMVYELAEHQNKVYGLEIIPQRTISKPPSAELRPNQKDEDSLPPYTDLDPILQYYIEENLSADAIVEKGFKREMVERVICMVDRAEFKRRQAAPGLRITTRAFGSGRRMPIARKYDS